MADKHVHTPGMKMPEKSATQAPAVDKPIDDKQSKQAKASSEADKAIPPRKPRTR